MTNQNGQPPAKRARTTRIHNASDYAPCPCYKCQGDLQLPRTIADHRTRNPWPILPPSPISSSPSRGNSPIPSFNGALNDPGNTEQASRGSNSPPIQHTSLPRHRSPSIRHPSPELPHDNGYVRTPSPRARRRAKRQTVIDDLPGFDPNDQREHRFDELLPGPAFPDLDVDDELLDPNLRLDEPEEDDPFDEFGLPRGHNELPGEEQPPPPFGLPWENQADNPDPNPEPEPEPEPDKEAHPAEYCAAFQEHRLIRNAYVDAAVQKILYGANQRALTHHLKAAQRQLYDNPNVPADDLARMALTIRTVERRLGLDPRDIITTYTLCPLCGRLYHPNYIADAITSTCQNNNCDGVLYDIHQLASGQMKHISQRTCPCASVIAWLRRMLNQAGMSELVQNEQVKGNQEPILAEQWEANLDMDRPLGDIRDGYGLGLGAARSQRIVNEQTGNVEDWSLDDPPVRLSSLPFGLSLTLSTDWFQPTREGNYSVGACFISLNNLPRHL